MKEIGETLKEARENIGISIEEAATDLKLRPSQIENIETGNIDAFKDIFYLKQFIKEYSKYLGLSYDDMIDEFNEYLFDYTSKISLDDIRKAKKKIEKKRKKDSRVASPYTIEKKEKPDISHTVLYIALGLLILTMSLLVINQINQDKTSNDDNVLASV